MNTINDLMLLKQYRKENNNVSARWLRLHFFIIIGFVIVTFIMEIIMFLLFLANQLIDTSIEVYLFKYLFFPSLINFSIAAICTYVVKCKYNLSLKYSVLTLALTLICFIVSFVHSGFECVNFVFILPIIISVVYGNNRLCTKTFLLSTLLKFISTQFINWDGSKIYTSFFLFNNLLECFFLLCFYALALLIICFEQRKQIEAVRNDLERSHLKKAVRSDVLTNVYNRYALQTYFNNLKEQGKVVHMVLLDIDDFKEVNDTYGHIGGDEVLVHLGEIMLAYEKQMVPFRFGGDEFCLLFEGMELNEVLHLCNQIRKDYKIWVKEKMQTAPYTLSIGIAEYDGEMNLNEFIDCADKALYRSKHNGKNKVSLFSHKII